MTIESALLGGAGLVAALALALLWAAWRYRRLRKLAEASVGPVPLGKLERPALGQRLQGQAATITVLFLDIRNFTRLSENKPLEQVGDFLTTFFTAISPIIQSHGGSINSYLGDGLMALFGIQGESDHASRAVSAAVAIARTVRQHWGVWRGYPALEIGVGIHTGPAYLGVIGSPDRFSYTAVGETVNIAARLESATREHGHAILFSEKTYEGLAASDVAALRSFLDVRIDFHEKVVLKGLTEAVAAYGVSLSAPAPAPLSERNAPLT